MLGVHAVLPSLAMSPLAKLYKPVATAVLCALTCAHSPALVARSPACSHSASPDLDEWSHWCQPAEWGLVANLHKLLCSLLSSLPPAWGGRLSPCSAAVTGAPRCSLCCTLFFLALCSLRHFKTESKSKHSWLTSLLLFSLSFLEPTYE